MSKLDWNRIRDEKQAHRDRLAALPFAEKLGKLERLRGRAFAIRGHTSVAARRAQHASVHNALVIYDMASRTAAISGAIEAAFLGVTPTLAGAIQSRSTATPLRMRAASTTRST